ncbi:DUF551 domain-containing protein [Klebsiella aerogenes]|uniref:DUF551 domain-containing protein n=1 Tax=Klebsiella aerogenes TaxID=548 RepID=UPI00379E852F
MTKPTITRERLEQLANFKGAPVTRQEEQELARIALTAMDSEPVAWTDEEELRDANKGGSGYLFGIGHDANKFADPRRQIMLYRHAQPAVDSEFIPKNLDKALGVLGMAIPESREEFNFQTERWIQRLIDRVIRYADEFQEQPAPVVPAVSDDIGEIRVGRLPTMNQDDYPGLGDWWVQLRIGEDSDEVLARVYGATPQEANSRAEALACSAAMLQAGDAVRDLSTPVDPQVAEYEQNVMQAGNSPVSPDGYVMVPKEPTRDILDEFDSIIDYGAEDSEDAWRRLLAAAPQEVKP